jgi:hypothetical protein
VLASLHGTSTPIIPTPSPPGPAWLRNLLGDEYFRNVYQVSIGEKSISESDLRLIITLPGIKSIYLSNPRIVSNGSEKERILRDADLIVLKDQVQLQDLLLESDGITDECIKSLKGLVNLKDLGLRHSNLTAEGLQELRKSLPNTSITRP